MMNIPHASLALLAGASVICSSCVAPTSGYVSYATPGAVNAGAVWTNASYDANGFPIFGYSYGRPVYGYTSAGVAIFTIAALTALCYVPYWGPAWWYRGSFYYPHGIHRVPAPPAFPHGHRPGVRPPGGVQPPPPPPGGARPLPPSGPSIPKPSSPPAPGPNPAISTMPAPSVRVAPVPGTSSQGMSAPGISTMPAGGGFSMPKPVSPSVIAPKPAISTMPAPSVRVAPVPRAASPGVSTPRISTMPAGGGFSIPKPAGSSAPTTVRVGPPASASSGGPPISTMRAGARMPHRAR